MTTDTILLTKAANDNTPQIEIDQTFLEQKLTGLKALDLSNAVVNVYAVKASTTNKKKRFQSVMLLPCKLTLENNLRSYVTNCIEGNEHMSELREITTSQDNRFFYVESAATDFQQIIELIRAPNIPSLSNKDQLNAFNGYVIKLTINGETETNLYAFRYIATAWSVTNSAGKFLCFDNDLIADLSAEPRFAITPFIDMIQAGDGLFIADIEQFEKAMNYRERLEQKKNEAIEALASVNALTNGGSEILSRAIGTDKHLMRQLASVYAKPFYNDDIWLTKLNLIAEKPESSHWLIEYDSDKKIIVKEDKKYIHELLTLLQNKRVRTVVDGVEQDVDGELINLPAAS
ncbi:Kiwa anti-phage protein KwaB-like domain-containing protein [Endozoicomonas acroporae]|uniref:Kiwa anti-phage protein KwaB-like domain-containing protein n=1 Tax=Endozoicomonas acroporae TaxID=1701104 RepID=UPI0013D72AFE|nr:Kiwa anti-phage protein KwaB-like domain-containing protein [Endozoicomonas acroporae]